MAHFTWTMNNHMQVLNVDDNKVHMSPHFVIPFKKGKI